MKTCTFVELHIPEFYTAIKFYQSLGFEIVWMDDEYLVMKMGKNVLNFYKGKNKPVYEHSYFKRFPHDTKRGYAVEIIIQIENIKSYYQKIKDKVNVVKPLELKHWGAWDFRIEDPFGFYLRFTEPHDWINDRKKIEDTKNFLNNLERK